jgi:hypothetical protein
VTSQPEAAGTLGPDADLLPWQQRRVASNIVIPMWFPSDGLAPDTVDIARDVPVVELVVCSTSSVADVFCVPVYVEVLRRFQWLAGRQRPTMSTGTS